MSPHSDLLDSGLSKRETQFIKKAAQLFIPEYDVVVFGSRARGTHRQDSDVDLAVYGSKENVDHKIMEFENVMHNSLMRPTVAVVQMNLVTGTLRNEVIQFGKLLYGGASIFEKLKSQGT